MTSQFQEGPGKLPKWLKLGVCAAVPTGGWLDHRSSAQFPRQAMNPSLQQSMINHVLDMVRTRWPDLKVSEIQAEAAAAVSSARIELPNGIGIIVANDLDQRPFYSLMRVAGGPAGRMPFEGVVEGEDEPGGGVPATDNLTATDVLHHVAQYGKWTCLQACDSSF